MNRKKGLLLAIAIVAYLAALFFVNRIDKEPLTSTEGQSYEKATVSSIKKDNLQEDGNRYGEQQVMLHIDSGSEKGKEVEATSPGGTLFGADCVEGMHVIAIISVNGDEILATVYAQDRSLCILGFLVIFIVTVLLIGGKKGAKAIASLFFTLVSIFFLLFPLLYRGCSPFWVTVLIAAVTTVFTILFVGGCNRKSFAAIVGTVSGVVIAGITAQLFGKAAGITGYNVSDIEALSYVAQYTKIKIGGLLFAGILISSLGAVMDVGMSMAATMAELKEKKPDLTARELFQSGIHVGRDMMGTMTNTLILAYVGGSLSTLLLNYAYDLSANQLINSYQIGIEIMQGLSGSLGIVLTVPVTAAVSAFFLTKQEK
ncbi:MAG: YibE/F family protein [Lachnospiraceae bacterium]